MLSQNFPFTPLHQSWQARRRELVQIDRDEGKLRIQEVMAQVLSNLRPPYAVAGGVYDVLTESQGDMLIAGNRETRRAMDLFQQAEGIDIDAAAGVALATLTQARREGRIERDALVLLNITGGGWCKMSMTARMRPVQPDVLIDEREIHTQAALERVLRLF
jgi:cysteate synthase